MKKVLLASTALVLAGGMAMADVETSGSGRMGIISLNGADAGFTSRIRISFSASGETDGGLSFGGSIRADNAAGGNAGTAGSVFAEGAFGRISMGDVDGAAKAAVGHVSGVGLTGLGDLNEIAYLTNVGTTTPGALYENSFGDLTFYLSADNPNDGGTDTAVGLSYGMGNYTVAVGYEMPDGGDEHLVVGLSAGFGDATVKAVYGDSDALGDGDQYAVSLDYVFGATTATVFYNENGAGQDHYGIGASYDLGGGASLKGGIVDGDSLTDASYDFGLNMSF
jgi:outer membrane protein OmpU